MNSKFNPKFFITGGTGFLGKKLVTNLSREFPLARFTLLKHNRPILETERIKPVEALDLNDHEIVIHLAAATHADGATYRQVNVIGTKNLIQAALEAKVSHFIFISTTAIGEDCGAYGASKQEAEEIIKNSGIPYTILRLSEVYGEEGNEGISKLVSIVKRFPLVPYITNTELAPLYVDDAIETITKALSMVPKNQIYTLSGPEVITFRNAVEIIASNFNKKIVMFPLPIRVFKPFVTAIDQIARLKCIKNYDNTSAKKDLSFSPRSFKEGLSSLVL